ncbi:MAG: hypothetical protein KatS3mg004_0178 [Bryobacteraceae bacterium]|nr:MAG: hypothetical protein KatS3mg004_0178 [Bryobacteraceae bacterium]
MPPIMPSDCVSQTYPTVSPVGLACRGLSLAPLCRTDLELLHQWEADPSSLHLWTMRKDILSQEEFVQALTARLRSYFHLFFMILHSGRRVGFIYSYEANLLDGYAFVTAFVEPGSRSKGIAARAALLFVHHLFTYYPFHKLYCDVFEYNRPSLDALLGAGLRIEGKFCRHRFLNGRHWTVYRLALYRDEFYRRFSPALARMAS